MQQTHIPSDADMAHAMQRAIEAREHRRRCAAVAARLLERAPRAAPTLDWDSLAQVPAWLAWPDAALTALQRQVGALLCAPALRLWIDAPRLAAARSVLGERFLQVLLAPSPWTPPRVPDDLPPRIDHAQEVHAALQSAGAAVLIASLPTATLRAAAAALLSHEAAAGLSMSAAQAVIEHAMALDVAAHAKEPQ